MVGNITSGQSFGQLAWYLAEKDPERVAWSSTRNTLETDARKAASEMQKTAALSERVEKPVYHVSVSLDPGDDLSREELEAVADQTLDDLGLSDHEAALVAHNDTDHPHVHIMVNRVHPETGKAWHTSFSRRRLRSSLERQERELGVRLTGGNRGREKETGRQPSRSIGEVKEAERERPFPDQVRERALSDFKEAASWADLEERLSGHGYQLVGGRARGGVVTDGERRAKLSKISRSVSRTTLDERFGQTYTDHKKRGNDMATSTTSERTEEIEHLSSGFRAKLEGAREGLQSAGSSDEVRQAAEGQGLEMEGSGREAEFVNPGDRSERISAEDLASAYNRTDDLAPERGGAEHAGEERSVPEVTAEDIGRDSAEIGGERVGPDHAGEDISESGAGRRVASGDGAAPKSGRGKSTPGRTTGRSRSRGGGGVRAAGEVAREVIEPMEEESDAMKKAARLTATLARLAERARRRRHQKRSRERAQRQTGARGSASAASSETEVSEEAASVEGNAVDRAEAAIQDHERRRERESEYQELRQAVEEAESELEETGRSEAREQPTPDQQEELRERAEEGRRELSRLEEEIGAAGADASRRTVGERVAGLTDEETGELKERISGEEMRRAERAKEDHQVKQVQQDARAYQEVRRMEKAREEATRTITEGEQQLTEDDRARAKLDKTGREFEESLEEAYQNPDEAKARFERVAEEQSAADASRQMRRRPEDFGDLKQTERRAGTFSTETTDEPAREAASEAANRGKVAQQLSGRVMEGNAHEKLKKAVNQARDEARSLTKSLSRQRGTQEIRKKMGRRMKGMSKEGTRKALDGMTPKGAAVAKGAAKAAGGAVLEATRDRDHGHGM